MRIVFSVMVSALKFLIGGILTWDGSILKGKLLGVIASSILQYFQCRLWGQMNLVSNLVEGFYVLRSKGEGNQHRKRRR